MKLTWFLLSVLLPLNLAYAYELPLPNKPHLIIEGYGKVEQVPDIIKIHFNVSNTASNLTQAKTVVDNTVGQVIKAARKFDITDDQINASKIQADPQYEWNNNSRTYTGENVTRQIVITLQDADRYNALIDALLKAGINRVQNIEMDFSDRTNLENKAMKLALKDAKQKATNISNTLDQKLGTIFQIAPITQQAIIFGMAMHANDSRASKESALKLGKQAIEERVRVVYLLTD